MFGPGVSVRADLVPSPRRSGQRTTSTERRPISYVPSVWLPTRLLVRPFQLVEA